MDGWRDGGGIFWHVLMMTSVCLVFPKGVWSEGGRGGEWNERESEVWDLRRDVNHTTSGAGPHCRGISWKSHDIAC